MSQLKKILDDIFYVSKITGTKNKKILVFSSVVLSQLTAFTDVAIISIFSLLVVGEKSGIYYFDLALNFIEKNKFILIIFVILRFLFMYFQRIILMKIELNVSKNLKVYILREIFDKKNYSVADTYFYINTLSTHISFFYSSFAAFANSFLQIIAYSSYLILTDIKTVGLFGVGVTLLIYPIYLIVKRARSFMHQSYEQNQISSGELQRVVDNLFLIKILKMENLEVKNFSNTLDRLNFNLLNNLKYGLYNSYLPSFLALFIFSLVLSVSNFSESISLVFIGVTLRLFQSFSGLTTALNQVINSQVHIEQFSELENNKIIQNSDNFKIINENIIKFDSVSFQYFNSKEPIFQDVNLKVKKNTHTIITGPNGSGKSTLLGLMSGIYYSNKGRVETFSDKYAYIGANPLIFNSSLYENIIYGNDNEVSEEKILEYLLLLETFKEKEKYNLKHKISNKTLSSGQMQKIAFIRALISNAEILILDEATANLDEKSKKIIFELLKKQNITIINSTHLINEFPEYDNHIEIKIVNEQRIIEYKKLV